MRLYSFIHKKKPAVGAEKDGALVVLPFASIHDIIEGGPAALAAARKAVASARAKSLVPLRQARLLAPLSRPSKMLFSGVNYKSHLEEENMKPFQNPRCFSKLPQTIIGPGAPIPLPGKNQKVDYEVELAVVIGRKMRHVSEDRAVKGVFGYTIVNDISARATQFVDNQETLGKNFDGFCPMGPCIVTADEIPDPAQLQVQAYINGRKLQDESNTTWIFSLGRVLSHFASVMTLNPGDVITTGTPGGIGACQHPPIYLNPGDTCRMVIAPIGELVNKVRLDPRYRDRKP